MELDLLQLSFLAILQGITEFLPISSSGHLVLPSQLLGWPDQGLAFDVAVHVGSLFAVLFYFRQSLLQLCYGWCRCVVAGEHSSDSRLAWMLIVATLPAGFGGLLLENAIEEHGRSLLVIAISSILFSVILYLADKRGTESITESITLDKLDWKTAILIGIAQLFALIPGASRSGVTMTAALYCNLSREAAARFSFFLAIPIILASGLLKSIELLQTATFQELWFSLAYGAVLSGIVAFACIHYFLKLIPKLGFLPFVLYRIGLGIALITFYYL